MLFTAVVKVLNMTLIFTKKLKCDKFKIGRDSVTHPKPALLEEQQCRGGEFRSAPVFNLCPGVHCRYAHEAELDVKC